MGFFDWSLAGMQLAIFGCFVLDWGGSFMNVQLKLLVYCIFSPIGSSNFNPALSASLY